MNLNLTKNSTLKFPRYLMDKNSNFCPRMSFNSLPIILTIFTVIVLSPTSLASNLRAKRAIFPSFTSTSYSFTVSTCTIGTMVGQVVATATGDTVTAYMIVSSNGQFAISSTGVITVALISATTQTITVMAITATGGAATIPVTITVSCTSGSATNNGRAVPVFQASSYAFTVACSRIRRLSVGLIWASNTYGDTLNYSLISGLTSTFFVDPNSGHVKSMIPVPTAGTYSLTAQASDPYGNTATVPLTITVTGIC